MLIPQNSISIAVFEVFWGEDNAQKQGTKVLCESQERSIGEKESRPKCQMA